MFSVVILTKNEERDLPGCLRSVEGCNDVVVFDSFSTDRTVEIATHAGARVLQRAFDNYAAQRNASLHEVGFRWPWVLILDADERLTPALRDELVTLAASETDCVAARMRRRDFLGATWLRRSQLSPFYVRFVRPQRVHYERAVNEVLKVDGLIAEMRGYFDHFPFSKGIRHWVAKHNTYSTMEADLVVETKLGKVAFSWQQAFFAKDFNERRFHQKELFYRLPFRPLIKFFLIYFARAGLLDGRAGFTYATLQSFYEYLIVLKTREAWARTRGAGE